MPCYDGSDEIEQRKDEIRKRIREARATHVLCRMIEREEDIEASVAALESMVPAGCETLAPPPPNGVRDTDRLLRERARGEGI